MQVRSDWLDPVGLYHTQARQRRSTTREDQAGQTLAGAFAQTEIEWTRSLRTTFGLRANVYRFSVTSDHPLNSGDGSDGILSPEIWCSARTVVRNRAYVNAGMGFHSNDAARRSMLILPTVNSSIASRRSCVRVAPRWACERTGSRAAVDGGLVVSGS